MKGLVLKLYNTIRYWARRLEEDAVSAFSAQAAFFIVLAAFPLFMLLSACLRYLPWNQAQMQAVLLEAFPNTLQAVAEEILTDIYAQSSGTVLFITAITALWSVSRGMYALLQGIRAVYKPQGLGQKPMPSWQLRALSVVYTVFLLLMILFLMGLWLLGKGLQWIGWLFYLLRIVGGFCFMVLFCMLLYTAASPKDGHIYHYFPGALLSGTGWYLFTYAYLFYINGFSGFSKFYGSLTSVVFLMLWLYFCMYILLAGAECNEWLQEKKGQKGDS